MDIQATAVKSARDYFKYTKDHQRSIVEHPITRIEKDKGMFLLHPLNPLQYPVCLLLRIEQTLFDERTFHVTEFDKEHNVIRCFVDEPLHSLLDSTPID